MTKNITALQTARREQLAQRNARLAGLVSQPLTVETVIEIAKMVTCQTPVVAAATAEGDVRLMLKYEGTGDNAVRLLNTVRDTFLRNGRSASLGREATSGQIILTVERDR